MRLLALIGALLALLGAGMASAHTRSESHSSWLIDGRFARASFTLAAPEARRLTADGRLPTGAAFLAYVAAHLTLADHGQPCASAGRLTAGASANAAASGHAAAVPSAAINSRRATMTGMYVPGLRRRLA